MSRFIKLKRKTYPSLTSIQNEKLSADKVEAAEVITCSKCKTTYNRIRMRKELYVCQGCGKHLTVSARERIIQLIDRGSFKEQNQNMTTGNPLKFPGYKNKIKEAQFENGNKDAIITGCGTIHGQKVEIAVLDATFMMGSMGTVVGEKFTLAVEYAMKNELPFVAVCASGGARMQEGMFSLMQMAKTSGVIQKFSDNGGFFVSVLTNPTMGGVSASFATLGDVIAEPDALVGFAGPRVIEQTINQTLPEGFQRSEFLQTHGFVDMIVERRDLKETIGKLLCLHRRK